MNPTLRTWLFRIVALQAVLSLLWFAWPFLKSARSQALAQHERLVGHVAHRNWKLILALMAEDYHDAWDMKRDEAVSLGHELLQGFLVLNLDWKTTGVSVSGQNATITGHLKASGSGAGFSQEIINRLNQLRDPFVFTWRKESWKPGSWKLISVGQPELAGVSLREGA